MNCDLLFNVGDAYTPPINEALVVLDMPYDADWPLDAINEGLKISYDYNLDLPWIYPILSYNDSPYGYVVMPRNDNIDPDDEFWNFIHNEGHGDRYQRTFNCATPSVFPLEINGVTAGIVIHQAKYGPAIPTEPVNIAISQIMSQHDWLSSAVVWLYPVRKLDSTWTSGIWIATQVDDLGDSPQMDDLMFTRIRDLNKVPKIHDLYPQFAPRRFT